MNLSELLTRVVEEVHGAQLAGVVGTDGLGVEMVIADEGGIDRSAAEIELGELAAAASATASRLQAGEVRDLILEAEGRTFLAASVSRGYFAVLGVTSNGNLGRARFALHQMVERIRDVL